MVNRRNFLISSIAFLIVADVQCKAAQEVSTVLSIHQFSCDLTLKVVPVAYSYKSSQYEPKAQYHIGEDVVIEPTLFYKGLQKVSMWIYGNVAGWRPQLAQGRLVVPYRRDVASAAKADDEGRLLYGAPQSVNLEPGKAQKVQAIALKEYYEPLTAGEYRIRVSLRYGRKMLNSNETTFEVVE